MIRNTILRYTKVELLAFLLVFFSFCTYSQAQCPVSSIPDTVCMGSPFNIPGTLPVTGSHYWDFCPGDLNLIPQGSNLGNIGGFINGGHQISMVEDNGTYYGFICNLNSGFITRYNFGNDPANTPTTIQLSTPSTISGPTGIQIIREGNQWYGLVSNYLSSKITLLTFGTSILNSTPLETDLGSLGTLNPVHLKGVRHQNNWFFLVANLTGNNVSAITFTGSITNAPAASTISSGFFNAPFGLDLVYDCITDRYVAIVANLNTSSPVVLDFGNTPANVPVLSSISGLPLSTPTSVDIVKESDEWRVFFADQSNKLTQANFGNSLLNSNPTVIFNGTVGNMDIPRGLEFVKHNSKWYGMVVNWAGSFTRISFQSPCNNVPQSSKDLNPSGIVFNTGGYQKINLTHTDSNFVTRYFTDSVFVYSPTTDFSVSSNSCDRDFSFTDLSVTGSIPIISWLWEFGDGDTSTLQDPTHTYLYAGNFNVKLTITLSGGCSFSIQKPVINNKPTASFSVLDGCAVPPLLFNNLTPDPLNAITAWYWDFGDSNTSTALSPSHTYTSAGNFNVTLIATSNACSDSISLPVTFNFKPDVKFNISNTCIGQTTNFTNLSSIFSGTITSYNWDFGDGNTSTDVNPIHTYADTGTYVISLTAIASTGCNSTYTKTVKIGNVPVANFTSSSFDVCLNDAIQFTDQSTLSGGVLTNWHWNFGNGNTSNLQNPNYTYPASGTYTVTLTVWADTNCVSSTSANITVNPLPQALFQSNIVMAGTPTVFTDNSTAPSLPVGTSITLWNWTFGDGGTSNLQNPNYLYASLGTYNVSLTVTTNIGCSSTITGTATVNPFVPIYYVLPDTVCEGSPFDISTVQPDSVKYYWDFCLGDLNTIPQGNNLGNINGLINAAHQISVVENNGNYYGFVANFNDNNIIRYEFGNNPANTPTAQVISPSIPLSNPSGIQVIKEGNEWFAIVSNYSSSEISRLSFGTSLTNNSPINTILGGLNTLNPIHVKGLRHQNNWYFLVANLASTNLVKLTFNGSITNAPIAQNITHTSITNQFGVDILYDSDNDRFVSFVSNFNSTNLSVLDFGNTPDNIPVITSISGLPVSSPTGIDVIRDGKEWHAFIVDQNNKLTQIKLGENLLNTSPQVVFNDTIGSLNIPRGLEFINHNSTWYGLIVNWAGSMSKVTFASNCTSSPAVSSFHSPSGIIFNSPGLHHIMLSYTDTNLVTSHYIDSIFVKSKPILDFSFNALTCNSTFDFTDLSVVTDDPINSWFWDFGDGNNSNSQNPSHSYNYPGTFNVTLTVNTVFGCSFQIQKSLVNNKPKSNFSFIDGCVVPPILFTNTTPDPQNMIMQWKWDFGDGNVSSLQSPNHTYLNPGLYTVTLVAYTSTCSDTNSYVINYKPKPAIGFEAQNTCFGQVHIFNNLTTISGASISSYSWNLGDGTTSNAISPTHTYADTGSYIVTLIALANNGCGDTLIKTITISNPPNVDFSSGISTKCAGNFILFSDLTSLNGGQISGWHWDFGNGDTSILQNPSYAYPSPGAYSVTLSVRVGTNCISNISKNIVVYPAPTALFFATTECLGGTTMFSDNSIAPNNPPGTFISQWSWDFKDSTTSNVQNPNHLYASPGQYPVVLTVTTDLGCTAAFSTNVNVNPVPVSAFNYSLRCSGQSTSFTDNSVISTGNITQWYWEFGDPASGNANISTLKNPTHTFANGGTYFVKLRTTSDLGCSDSITIPVTIFKSPSANFSSTSVCDGNYVQFSYVPLSFPSTATNWSWNFGNGSTSTLVNPAVLFLTYGTYNVTLTVSDSSSGCAATSSRAITVNPKPKAIIPIQTPCVGQASALTESSTIPSGSIVNWTWDIQGYGIFNQRNPVINFTSTGPVLVKLTVTSAEGCIDTTSKIIQVSDLPVSKFVFNPTTGGSPLLVNFSNQSVSAVSYQWYFGNGSTSTLPNPSHTYQDTGRYTISLVAYNINGCRDSITKSIYVIQPKLDAAILNISSLNKQGYLEISAEIVNLGTHEINSLELIAEISQNNPVKERWTGSLLPGNSLIYTFKASFKIDDTRTPDLICVAVQNPNDLTDQVQSNNRKCSGISDELLLMNPYPNPASSTFNLQFILPAKDFIRIELFDNNGKYIKELYSGNAVKGYDKLEFSISDLSIGTYSCRFVYKETTITKIIIKI